MSEINEILEGNEQERIGPVYTQVYLATHDGADKRLPLMNRSFISFSYGGKWIEDMPFVSVVENNFMTGDVYGKFQDNTSTYDVIDGQFYWGSHFTTNEFSFKLATDEITDKELDEFKHWFQPGQAKELILAEHPNRAIMARVSQPPKYNLIPFGKEITKTIKEQSYKTMTTVYRGDISLTLVADDPFWYSIYNILPTTTKDANDNYTPTLSNEDYLKVIYEDEVPTRDMLTQQSMITGDQIHDVTKAPKVGDHLGGVQNNITYPPLRLVSTPIIIQAGENGGSTVLYYAGTAPAPTQLKFSLTPVTDTSNYISYPKNKIWNTVSQSKDNDYNTIFVGREQQFKFTTPGIYTGYNQALQVISEIVNGMSVVDIKILLHEKVNEYYSRSWAITSLNYLACNRSLVDNNSQVINTEDLISEFTNFMMAFLGSTNKRTVSTAGLKFKTSDEENKTGTKINITSSNSVALPQTVTILTNTYTFAPKPASFVFNSRLGTAEGTFTIRVINDPSVTFKDYVSMSDFITKYTTEKTITENVGDMVYEKYLYLTERNYINDEGYVTAADCTPVFTDYPYPLSDFYIKYKHMYL